MTRVAEGGGGRAQAAHRLEAFTGRELSYLIQALWLMKTEAPEFFDRELWREFAAEARRREIEIMIDGVEVLEET